MISNIINVKSDNIIIFERSIIENNFMSCMIIQSESKFF
jgi:hypothetical protein